MFRQIDPVKMTTKQSQALGLTLLRAYTQNNQIEFPEGKQTISIYDPVMGPVEVDLDLAHPVLIRPSENKPGQICLEVLGKQRGDGAFSEYSEILTTLIPLSDGSLRSVARGRGVKAIDLAYEKLEDAENEFHQAKLAGHLGVKPLVVGQQKNVAYLIGKHFPGANLEVYLKAGVLANADERLRLCIELIRMLDEQCHAHGSVHRDVKPANIIIDPTMKKFPRVYYVDYGFAKNEFAIDARVIGTPIYQGPEAWRGENATFAADIYSLGVVLSQVLGASEPDEVRSYEKCLSRQFLGMLNGVLGFSPEHRAQLSKIIKQMCAVNPRDRSCLDYVASSFERIRFERVLKHAEEEMRGGLQAAHDAAKLLRKNLAIYSSQHQNAWDVACIGMEVERAMIQFSDVPAQVDEFVTMLGIRAFYGMTTKDAVSNKMQEITRDFYCKHNALLAYLQEFNKMFSSQEFKQFHHGYQKYLKMLYQNCQRRSALTPVSVDGALALSQKYMKDLGKLKIENEYIKAALRESTIHLPVTVPLVGSMPPVTSLGLFARKVVEDFPIPTVSLLDHVWTRVTH